MPERTRHAPGSVSWADLATTDVAGAQDFYASVFGWEYDEQPAGDQGTYVMASLRGKAVAGIMEQGPEMAAAMPPMWNVYVTVADVDATSAKVAAAGGDLLQPAFDVMEAGRMAVVADPVGAVLCLWEPRAHAGSELVDEPGALAWAELYSPDVPAASAFYEQLLGWRSTGVEGGGASSTTFSVEGVEVAGAMAPPVDELPATWSVWFGVDDVAAAVEAVRAGGGSVVTERFDLPAGRGAVLADPAGGTFSVLEVAPPG